MTYGVVVPDFVASNGSSFIFYHVECAIPIFSKALQITVSLQKSTGLVYVFGGFSGANMLNSLYFWNSSSIQSGSGLLVLTGIGFRLGAGYRCIFSGKNSTSNTNFSYTNVVPTNSTTLVCGLGELFGCL